MQVAGILKDKEMSANVLDLMSVYNKDALPLAKKFIDNAFNSTCLNNYPKGQVSIQPWFFFYLFV